MGKKKTAKLLVITSCTGKKLHKPDNQLVQSDFQNAKKLAAGTKKLHEYQYCAEKMYTGDQHLRLMQGIKALRKAGVQTTLSIVSAGYGLISGEEKIVPYECTFDSMKTKELDHWAQFLKIPENFRALLSDYDLVIVLLGKKYLRSLQIKKEEVFPVPIIFFCSNAKEIKNCNGTVFPAGIPETRDFHCGLVGLKGEIFRVLAEEMASDSKLLTKIQKKPEQAIFLLDTKRKQKISSPDKSSQKTKKAKEQLLEGYKNFKDCPPEIRRGKPSDYQPPKRVTVRYTPRKKAKMLYFIPEWDDRVDPHYDFINDFHYSELFGVKHDSYRDDYYAHELMGQYNYDGILVSKVTIEQSKKKKALIESIGIHGYLRCPKNVPVMGDCGAFGYINEYDPPYTTEEIVDYYQRLGFDYGVIIDHLIVPGVCQKMTYWLEKKDGSYRSISAEQFEKFSKNNKYRLVKSPPRNRDLFETKRILYQKEQFDIDEAKRRWQLTLDNGREFLKVYKKGKNTFVPMASCQGWDVDSYAKMFKEFQKMGYEYIALGGLVRSPSSVILEILEGIDKIRKPKTKIHLFGIGRLEVVKKFIDLGVYSCDSASQLRIAWLGADKNYWAKPKEKYSAIRIPPIRGHSTRIKQMLRDGKGTMEEFEQLENEARRSLWNFDQEKISLDQALESVLKYDRLVGANRDRHEKLYRQTLESAPWKQCSCILCRLCGIEVILFRRNNRNRRRGFHNTYVFFEEFKKLT